LELKSANQTSIYTGRGYLVESQGPTWLYGTASEHNVLYQYNFAGASNVFAGQMQTESPYYTGAFKQQLIDSANSCCAGKGFATATTISPPVAAFKDPTFSNCAKGDTSCDRAWGLISQSSSALFFYGYGAYSFFDIYMTTCIKPLTCQARCVFMRFLFEWI
jgi:glucan 1,3-beta-glucosidase